MKSRDDCVPGVLRLADYLIVLRPTLLFPGWTLLLLGYYHGRLHQHETLALTMFPQRESMLAWDFNPSLWRTFILYGMLMGAVYIINQIADRETDARNEKLYLVAQGHVRLNVIKAEAGALLIGAAAWALLGFYQNPSYLVLIGLSIFLGIIYSVPPLRLKGRPILDLLANAIGYGGVAFLVGWAVVAPIDAEAGLKALPYVLCVGAAFVNTTLPDLTGDSAEGVKTTGVWLGWRRSCAFSLMLLCAALLSAWLLRDGIALITGLVCLPFFVHINFTRQTAAIIRATRIGILALTLLACLVFPAYGVVFGGIVLAVRWYYRARFGMTYP